MHPLFIGHLQLLFFHKKRVIFDLVHGTVGLNERIGFDLQFQVGSMEPIGRVNQFGSGDLDDSICDFAGWI